MIRGGSNGNTTIPIARQFFNTVLDGVAREEFPSGAEEPTYRDNSYWQCEGKSLEAGHQSKEAESDGAATTTETPATTSEQPATQTPPASTETPVVPPAETGGDGPESPETPPVETPPAETTTPEG